ncbi:MAG: hypothetical protein ACRDFR_02265, partial [Candidatus Limnocylindria bacterium]
MIELVAWSGSELEGRTEEVTVDAFGEDEQLGAFACVLDDLLEDPAPASVLREAVELLGVRAGGRVLGLRARCRRQGWVWEVALVDVTVAAGADPELA